MVRWLNDSSGFTYHRNTGTSQKNLSEICLYDVQQETSTTIAEGMGGVLSPQKDKLLWFEDDRAELRITHFESGRTYRKHIPYLIDYAWAPDGKHVVFIRDGLLGGKVIITDDTLRMQFEVVENGPKMQNWDRYMTPTRWLKFDE
jgi:hypothetical protein